MPVCSALGCGNNTYKKPIKQFSSDSSEKRPKITFHLFPVDPVRKQQWIKIMKLEHKKLHRGSYLCSLHFDEKYLDRTSLMNVRLRKDAIPHLSDKQPDEIDDRDVVNEIDLTSVDTSDDDLNAMDMKILKDDDTEALPANTYSTCDKETNTPPLLLQEAQETKRKRSTNEKGTRVSPERILSCSAARSIQEANFVAVKNLKREIKHLEQLVKIKEKKILTFKSILDELKYISSDEDLT